jgi:hypothetical protein
MLPLMPGPVIENTAPAFATAMPASFVVFWLIRIAPQLTVMSPSSELLSASMSPSAETVTVFR